MYTNSINSKAKGILREYLIIIINVLVLFISARTTLWFQGWVYLGLILLHQTLCSLLLIYKNPSLLNKRNKIFSKNTTNFDRIFVFAYAILTIIISFIAGSENSMNPNFFEGHIIIGMIMFFISSSLGIWAMVVNPFFLLRMTKTPILK